MVKDAAVLPVDRVGLLSAAHDAYRDHSVVIAAGRIGQRLLEGEIGHLGHLPPSICGYPCKDDRAADQRSRKDGSQPLPSLSHSCPHDASPCGNRSENVTRIHHYTETAIAQPKALDA